MSGRRPLVAGNAKMNLLGGEVAALLGELVAGLRETPPVAEVVYCPGFTLLHRAVGVLKGSPVSLGAQDMYWKPSGAFTGEISAAMLLDAGCTHVILGHSERRTLFGETDAGVQAKARAALEAGLVPIVCVGETGEERERGDTEEVLARQVAGSLAGLDPATPQALIVAYEPVWAIGTGRNATAAEAQSAHAHLRRELQRSFGATASGIRLLYGGSVTPENAGQLLGRPDVDGALVGGASLKASSFLDIVRQAT